MRGIMDYTSKEDYLKGLLKNINEKCIIFANTQAQADRVCKNSYHSKNKQSEDNLEYFKENTNDLSFFIFLRTYLFWDKTTDNDINDLKNCLDWKKSYSELKNIEYKNICKWENKYIKDKDSNYFHIKDLLVKAKNILNWNKFSCSYFLGDNYKYDFSYISSFEKWTTPKMAEIFLKKNDYLFCKKISNLKTIDLKKELFFFNKALDLKSCNYLNDKNLTKLCDDEIKENTRTFKK